MLYRSFVTIHDHISINVDRITACARDVPEAFFFGEHKVCPRNAREQGIVIDQRLKVVGLVLPPHGHLFDLEHPLVESHGLNIHATGETTY